MFRSIGCCVTCTQYSPADCHVCIHIMTLEFEPMNQCIKYIVLEHSNVAFMIHDIGHKIYSHFDACSFADIYPYVYIVHWTLPKALTNAVYKCQKQRNLDKKRHHQAKSRSPSSTTSECCTSVSIFGCKSNASLQLIYVLIFSILTTPYTYRNLYS